MNYMPDVESMDRLSGGPLGPAHHVVIAGNVKSAGKIEYLYLLVVYEAATEKPVYIVASEANAMRDALGGGSHFLGVFDGNGHANLGDSDDWGDVDRFADKALALAAAHLGLRPVDDDDEPPRAAIT